MKTQVHYEGGKYKVGQTYGNDEPAQKYKLELQPGVGPDALAMSFQLTPPRRGRSDSDSRALVSRAVISIPKRQALAVATASLFYCRQADQAEPKAMLLDLDEDDVDTPGMIRLFD